MERTLRIRDKKTNVELSLWKLIPLFILVLLFLLSAATLGGSAGSGGAPSGFF